MTSYWSMRTSTDAIGDLLAPRSEAIFSDELDHFHAGYH